MKPGWRWASGREERATGRRLVTTACRPCPAGSSGKRCVLPDCVWNKSSAAGFGIAGYDWPSQRQAHLDALAPLGFACPLELTNNSIIGLLAGAPQGWGVVVIAGTGNNCRGRDRRGREGRITGEGIRFGEFGGGGEIVFKAIQSVAHAWTLRGPHTALTGLFMHLAGAESLSDLIEGIDLQRYTPEAGWALAVFQAARSGDPVAQAVIAWSARELGKSACAVIRQLGIEKETFDVVLVGSVFDGGDLYTDPLRETIHKTAPDAHLVRLAAPPVVGGVVLAMQKTGLETGHLHQHLTETTMRIVPFRRDG